MSSVETVSGIDQSVFLTEEEVTSMNGWQLVEERNGAGRKAKNPSLVRRNGKLTLRVIYDTEHMTQDFIEEFKNTRAHRLYVKGAPDGTGTYLAIVSDPYSPSIALNYRTRAAGGVNRNKGFFVYVPQSVDVNGCKVRFATGEEAGGPPDVLPQVVVKFERL